MNTDSNPFEARTDADHPDEPPLAPRDDRLAVELRSVVVDYENRPDRRTVYPEGLSSVERMATWLTADDDAFVDLDAVR